MTNTGHGVAAPYPGIQFVRAVLAQQQQGAVEQLDLEHISLVVVRDTEKKLQEEELQVGDVALSTGYMTRKPWVE